MIERDNDVAVLAVIFMVFGIFAASACVIWAVCEMIVLGLDKVSRLRERRPRPVPSIVSTIRIVPPKKPGVLFDFERDA